MENVNKEHKTREEYEVDVLVLKLNDKVKGNSCNGIIMDAPAGGRTAHEGEVYDEPFAMVVNCGSYITSNPNKNSGTDWKNAPELLGGQVVYIEHYGRHVVNYTWNNNLGLTRVRDGFIS